MEMGERWERDGRGGMPSVCLLTLGLVGTRTRMLQSAISLNPTPLMLQSAICLRIFPFHMQALFSCASVRGCLPIPFGSPVGEPAAPSVRSQRETGP
jgi:hypothetical protein